MISLFRHFFLLYDFRDQIDFPCDPSRECECLDTIDLLLFGYDIYLGNPTATSGTQHNGFRKRVLKRDYKVTKGKYIAIVTKNVRCEFATLVSQQ